MLNYTNAKLQRYLCLNFFHYTDGSMTILNG